MTVIIYKFVEIHCNVNYFDTKVGNHKFKMYKETKCGFIRSPVIKLKFNHTLMKYI